MFILEKQVDIRKAEACVCVPVSAHVCIWVSLNISAVGVLRFDLI